LYVSDFAYLWYVNRGNEQYPDETVEELVRRQQEVILLQQQLNETQAKSIEELTLRVQELLSQLAWLNRQLFGRRSEKFAHLDPNQPSLFEEPTVVQQLETQDVPAAVEPEIEKPEAVRKTDHRNRKMLEGLPVIEVRIEPENVDLERYKCIGEERTRTLEFEPGRLYVKETIRPKYGLKDNTRLPAEGESAVVIAPLPLLPIHKGLPGASMLAEILLQKYEYHVPFYRQIRSFRHLGLHIPENTLSGWFKPVAELLRPLYDELRRQVLQADYLQVDETTLPVMDKQSKRAKKEYLWVVRSPMKKLAFFHYDDGSRSGSTAKTLLEPFKGYLQCDGYGAYNVFEDSADVRLVGCMAHIRRGYEKALEENRSLAEHALGEIQRLYRIESAARERELSAAERRALREESAVPILDSFERWMERTYSTVMPRSRMGKAIAYSYSLWGRMKNYLLDGRLEIDNNGAERAIRPIALSRKNFLFCGNHRAAEDTAVICSLLASCKESGVNPRQYLTDVISRLPYLTLPGSTKDIGHLLPNHWQPIGDDTRAGL